MSKHYLQPATDIYGMSFCGVLCEGTFPTLDEDPEFPGSGDIIGG